MIKILKGSAKLDASYFPMHQTWFSSFVFGNTLSKIKRSKQLSAAGHANGMHRCWKMRFRNGFINMHLKNSKMKRPRIETWLRRHYQNQPVTRLNTKLLHDGWCANDNCRWSGLVYEKIKPSQLICPLDIACGQEFARRLSLLERKKWLDGSKTELTAGLEIIWCKDPVKYDFALLD